MNVRHALLGAAVVVTAAGSVSADTIATFADPAASGGSPLFTLQNNMLSGGWSGTGLDLHMPFLPGSPTYEDATFTMSSIPLTSSLPLAFVSGGSIDFFDSDSNPLMTISFDGGLLSSALSFGASEFTGFDVDITGPAIPFALTDESFAFAFANPASIQGGFTITSSFTSSATVPVPGTIALAGLGLGALARRRRN